MNTLRSLLFRDIAIVNPPLHLALGEVAVDNDADLMRCCC